MVATSTLDNLSLLMEDPCTRFRGFRLRVMNLSTAFLTKTLAHRFGPGNRRNSLS